MKSDDLCNNNIHPRHGGRIRIALAIAFILSAIAAFLASSTAQRIGSFLLALLGVFTAFFVFAVTVRKNGGLQ